MEILIVIFLVYCIHLIDNWLDRKSADRFVKKHTKQLKG